MIRFRSLAAAAVAIGLVAAGRPAHAKDLADNALYDLQLFHPAVDTKGYITVNASQVMGLWDFSIGLVGTLAAKPLRLASSDGKTTFHDDFLLTPTLMAALGFKYAELAVTVPVQINFGGWDPKLASSTSGTTQLNFSGQGVGDLGVHVKGRFLNTSKHPVGLAALVSVYLPYLSGSGSHNFTSDGALGLWPQLIVDKEVGQQRRFRFAANLGAHLRLGGTHVFKDDKGVAVSDTGMGTCAPVNADGGCGTGISRGLGNQITYGLAGSYAIVKDRFDAVLEAYGALPLFGGDGAKNAFPLELLLGMKFYLARNSFLEIGGGGSPVNAAGTGMTQSADWRIFLGFVYEPTIGDRDGDGLKDDVDKCPDEPEDFDDFEDNDGCPEPDNDRDGIPDVKDKCPNEPETKNGFQDEDGCPDEVDLDRDGDGIPDNVDKCPDDPEDKDGFEDEDGCPDPDNDKDLIPDVDDQCPNDPEDRDGFEDQDGCPDPDNDKDRILDKVDKCPNEPETYNGFEDEDGCPDKGRVVVRRGKLEILDKIYFETDKAIIKPISFPLLDAIVGTLKGNPQIQLLEVQGHADERGDLQHNTKLTEDRSQSVKQYLIDHGVAANRLQAHGYGETKPICKEHTEECWSKNRRVEFVILKRNDD